MRDPARAAGQSDPAFNRQFSRRWQTPQERNRPAPTAIGNRAGSFEDLGKASHTDFEQAGQRACAFAQRRAEALRQQAQTLAAVGLRDAALRAAALADRLRREVAL